MMISGSEMPKNFEELEKDESYMEYFKELNREVSKNKDAKNNISKDVNTSIDQESKKQKKNKGNIKQSISEDEKL